MADEIRRVEGRGGQQGLNDAEAEQVRGQFKVQDTDQDHVTQDDDLAQEINKQIISLKDKKASMWRVSMIKRIKDLVEQLIEKREQQVRTIDPKNEFAHESAANALRFQLRQMFGALNPPPEIAEADDFQELMQLLWPKSMRRKGASSFSTGSGMQGSVKQEVQQKLVVDAVLTASKRAGAKMQKQLQSQNKSLNQFSQMSLEHMSRALKRKMKKLKKGKVINEDGEYEEMTDEERDQHRKELQEMMEMFSASALETMKVLREEIAPEWAPEQQPWLLAEADKCVYDILLATADKEILQETQAWDAIQDLRRGDAVFTLRASDKLLEATARRK